MPDSNSEANSTLGHSQGKALGKYRGVHWFLAGAFGASAFWMLLFTIARPKTNQAQLLQPAINSLQMQNGELAAQLNSSRSQSETLMARLNTCTAKFSRGTFIYDAGVFGETRAWYIPADVDPVALGRIRGTYSHYSPATQTETVHLQPKTQ